MFYAVLFIHCLLCITLVGLVLMQQGKGAELGGAFGASSNSLFGAGGATDFVTKLTTSIAIGFMVTSIILVRAYSGVASSPQAVSDPLEGSIMQNQVITQESMPAETDSAVDSPAEEAVTDSAIPPQDESAAVPEGSAE